MSTVADSIPKEGIEFGYCGVNQISTKSFTLSNPTSSTVRFEISVENVPFDIYPLKGTILKTFFDIKSLILYVGSLGSKQKQEITIKYAPSEAKVVIATAVFKFFDGEEGSKVLKIGAVGKYPFITIN